jgi:two-component system, OmpR family, response regulator VicR
MADRSQERRKHIAVINSSPDFLLIARDLFEDEGYSVTTSDFVPTVFARIVMRHPDALIVDVAVDQPTGWELLEQLLAEVETADIPVLVTSTSPRLLEQAREQAPRYGTTRTYLTKPLELDELLAAVRLMIGEA